MTIKQQLIPLRIGKGLLSLVALFVMLLAPQRAWAQTDYGLTVAGVSVTSENASNITGQTISEGTVSYTPKTGTTPATLTLSSAYILGEIESSVDEDLAILVIGTNTITTSLDHAVIGKSGGTNNNLMLTYNGDGSGAELRVNGLSSIDELPLNWISCTKIWKTNEWDFGENEEGLNPDLCDWYTKEKCGFISIAPATKYNVWIGGIQLTSNHDSSDGVSFSENRLTLENATIAPANAYGIEYKGTDDFTILLKGKNSIQTTGSYEAIRYGGQQTAAPQLTFKEDTDGYPCSLQLGSAVTVISSGFGSIAGINGINQINTNDNNLELTPTDPLQYGTKGLVTTDETPAAVTSVKFGTPFKTYGVSVASTSVTSDNYNDVLNDGTVSFNSQTNTLTLNNATIDMSSKETGYPIESSITNLNVTLIGSSVFTPNSTSKSGIHYTGSESNPTVTLNIGDSAYGLLKVNGVSDRDAMFSGYTNTNSIVTQGDGWRTYTEGSGDDISSTLEYLDYYDMTVAGVPVTSKNATNIQGENITGSVSVSQDSWKIVLTLNGATISGGVVFDSSKDLYVNFNGENSISGGDSYAINSTDDTMTSQWIVFEKANNFSSATITLTNNTQNDKSGTIGGGFDVTKYDGLYRIDDNNATQFTTTFTTDLFANGSGTMSDPYIIKTANDLKNFSNYINRNVIENTACAKLSDDINAETGLDCANLTGFEPIGAGDLPYKGTFNGNGKTISNLSYTAPTDLEYVGLFGYVNGATITNLTINNCTFNGSKHVGGIAGYINDATISSCTVNNSTISCSNTENVDNVWTAGGIVGYCEYDPSGEEPTTVSGNNVIGETTVSCSKTAGNGNAVAGAIVGHHRTTTFTNNIYEYSVSVSTKQPTDEIATVSSGYTKRGSGCTIDTSDETPEVVYTLTDVAGITMYTKKVILPEETSEGSVMGLEGTYYDIFEDDTDWGILVAPGQTVTLNAIPGDGYVIASLTATNTTTETTISTNSEDLGDNTTQYTFIMPDAPVTVALTAAQTMGIRVAGVEVTELNADDVLGDGKVSFTPAEGNDPATLTLNNATIDLTKYESSGIIYQGTANLTISLIGTNSIKTSSGCEPIIFDVYQPTTVPSLTFERGSHPCSLELQGVNSSVIKSFGDVLGVNGINDVTGKLLKLDTDAVVAYTQENGLHTVTDNETTPVTSATIVSFLLDPKFCFYVGETETISNGETKEYEYGLEQTLPVLKRQDNGSLTGFKVTYTSSDENVATISNTGVITIVGGGWTEIRASIEATGDYAADEAWFTMEVIPAVPQVSIQDGAYFTGQKLTLTRVGEGGSMYYSFGYKEESDRSLYEGEISLPAGEYLFYPYTRCGTSENSIWSVNWPIELYVYDEPTISKDEGDYVGDIEVEITKLPNPPHRDNVSVTAYYYLGDDDDNEENDIRYTAGDKITVRESTKLNVYLLVEGDSGKKYKTKVIEREYTIKDIPLDVTAADFHNHWMTYYHNENGNVGLPEDQNIGAYVATSISGNEIVVTQIKSIPRGEPVLLNNATTTTTTNVFGQDVQGNLLVHATDVVDVAEKAGEGDFYGLYNGTFMRVTGTIPAGKNYLMVPNAVVPSGNAPQLTIVIDGEATGVNDVRSKMEDVRGDIYDLQGRKVQKPSKKGLYINKGHKVVVK